MLYCSLCLPRHDFPITNILQCVDQGEWCEFIGIVHHAGCQVEIVSNFVPRNNKAIFIHTVTLNLTEFQCCLGIHTQWQSISI